MVEWLAVWGVAKATLFVFRPIMEELAKDVAEDAAKSYVGKCFKSLFSAIYRDPLTKATGQALKELLELIQNELLDADLDRDELEGWLEDLRQFVRSDEVRTAIGSLFLDPDYHLDPATFARAWQQTATTHTLPDDFSWQRVAKRFARKISEIRQTSGEIRDTFESLTTARMSDDIRELRGLPPDFDLETYREALIERFGNLNFEMLDTTGAYYSGVRLWSVFVPQSAREWHEYTPQLLEMPNEHIQRLIEKGELDAEELAEGERLQDLRRREYFSQPLRSALEIIDDSTAKRAVVLGDPGSGKSSLLRFLALRWTQIKDANHRYTQPLPLLIELRDYNRWDCPNNKGFPRYLHEASTWHRLNQRTLDHLLRQSDRVVILLDGLDEVFDPIQREYVVNDIHRFSNEYPNTRIVVTSRVVGYQPQRLRDAEFRHFMLQDLDELQIGVFLDKWHEVTFDNKDDGKAKRHRLEKAINDSKPIAMLASNPLLLTMMAILNRHQELPRDRADLYAQASRVLLQQWDTERALEDYPELRGEVDLRAKTAILRRVAQAMQTGPRGLAGNIIDGEPLTNLIEDYLRDELHFDQSRAAAAAVVRQLRERNFILCFLGADSYAFVHRTFLEYFCAADIIHQFNIAKTLDEKGLIALFDSHCRDDDWREVLRLICGQIDGQFVGHIVEHLAKRTDLETWDGRTPLPELTLAVWCLSELRNVAKMASSGEVLMDAVIALYLKARPGNGSRSLEEIVRVSDDLGPHWPGDYDLMSASRELQNAEWIAHGMAQISWPSFVAAITCSRERILQFLAPGAWTIRVGTIRELARRWPDEKTRKLLERHAVEDEDSSVRREALGALAKNWVDEDTRKLLEQCAVEDEASDIRQHALRALAERWPSGNTQRLIEQRSRVDGAGAYVRGAQHSDFGRIVFTRSLFDDGSYLDPAKPISHEHIERAAQRSKIPSDEIDETVRSLSEHMGWDITKGSGA